jgi:hypothetical protein
MKLLTILIPTINTRAGLLIRLLSELNNQITDSSIIIDVLMDYQDASIGFRRNILLNRAESKYICFFDDDDMPTQYYIESIMQGMINGYDCCSLKGIYTVNGSNPEIFEHSLKYSSWKTNENAVYPDVKYERPPNHLNCIKADIAKKFLFKDISHGEDNAWSDMIQESGLIKSEYYINKPIYNYLKIS